MPSWCRLRDQYVSTTTATTQHSFNDKMPSKAHKNAIKCLAHQLNSVLAFNCSLLAMHQCNVRVREHLSVSIRHGTAEQARERQRRFLAGDAERVSTLHPEAPSLSFKAEQTAQCDERADDTVLRHRMPCLAFSCFVEYVQ